MSLLHFKREYVTFACLLLLIANKDRLFGCERQVYHHRYIDNANTSNQMEAKRGSSAEALVTDPPIDSPDDPFGKPWSRKPYILSVGLGGFLIIVDASLQYHITSSFSVGVSAFSSLLILSYEAYGFYLRGRMYLQPERRFSPYLSVGLGPLWKKERDAMNLSGGVLATQFGWDYTADSGFNASLSLGPIVHFVDQERTSFALFQLGLGWNF